MPNANDDRALLKDAPAETRNILEEGPLHKLMVFFQKAESLPAGAIILLQLLAAALVGAVWRAIDRSLPAAVAAGGALVAASLVDAAFFLWLPKARISFGPWKAQTVVLLTARALAGMALALLLAVLSGRFVLTLFIAAQACGSLLLWWAAAVEPRRLQLTQLEVRVRGLPAGMPPIRLLHISDIHLERMTGREQQLLAYAREAAPDLIVLTGDFLNLSYNRDEAAKRDLANLLQQLHTPYGVYATLGSPPADLREEIVPVLEALPLCLLRDEWTAVKLDNGAELALIGVDCTHHLGSDAAALDRVMQSVPDGAPRLLLYHSPELMPQAGAHHIDLYLCGHTHGGQVRLPLVGPLLTSSQLGRRYVMGAYREGRTQLYVSRGVGLEGLSAPRVRLLAAPEMTLVTLHAHVQAANGSVERRQR